MNSSVDEAFDKLNPLGGMAGRCNDDAATEFAAKIRSTLTAQHTQIEDMRQRIEQLESVLSTLLEDYDEALDEWFDDALEKGERLSKLAHEALNEATKIAQETGQYEDV